MTRRRAVIGTIAVTALVLLLGRWASQQYTDALWYESLGAGDVWYARFVNGMALRIGSFLAASAFAFVNLYAVRQSVVSLVLPRRIANIEIGEEVPSRYLLIATALLSALIGSALTLSGDLWWVLLRARVGQPFGESDPYFGADLGFFVYWLPLETEIYYWAMLMLLVVIGVVIVLYALTPSLRWSRGALYVSAYVRRHFTMLGGILLLALAWSYRLGMFRVLAEGSGPGGAFSSIDHRVTVPATLVLALVTLCAAVIVLWAGWTGQMRLAFFAVSAVLLLSLVARTVAPLVARRSVDPGAPDPQELRYQATRLAYTRRAYGVERIRADSLGTGFSTTSQLAPNVAVWDAATLARFTERERHVDVVGTGAGWTAGPSGLSAYLVERGEEGASDGREFWGIARYDAAAADERGQPVRAVPTGAFGDESTLDEPVVFDSAPGYSVLSDSLQRIAGVEMVSTRSRLAHAWALQNFRLLFGDLPATRPTIVRHRGVRERVEALAPYFVQGSEINPVVVGDSLYWALELYVASDDYPLAERFHILDAQRGYFQHAATALVHTASGRVRFVLAPAPEVVTASWVNRFPSLFVRSTALSRQLQAALPPVLDGAWAQALAFASAGFRGESLEVRHFASLDAADSVASREPIHAALPNFGVTTSWTLLDTQDRVRGIVASAGATRETSWIPLAPDGQRWGGTVDRLRAADTASHDGPMVHAPARVVPLAGRPMYFQAAFRVRAGASPTLGRVATITGDSLRTGPTLAAALGLASPTATAGPARQVDLRTRAESLYRDMRDALRRGDWPAFGRAFEALGGALRVAPR
ncbi:MAG TPA: UPF0182 family protein [Gemmatimonadaceae bacterium]